MITFIARSQSGSTHRIIGKVIGGIGMDDPDGLPPMPGYPVEFESAVEGVAHLEKNGWEIIDVEVSGDNDLRDIFAHLKEVTPIPASPRPSR